MNKITVVLVLVGLSMGVMAQSMNGNGNGKNENRGAMFKLLKQVDLTATQKTELKALRSSHKGMREAFMSESKTKRKTIRQGMKVNMASFMSEKTFDKGAFKEAMKQEFDNIRKVMEKRKEAMLEKRANAMEKVFNILTVEQRVKLIELSKK